MPPDAEALRARCADLHAALGEAIGWVADARRTVPRLDRDGDVLIETLRRSRIRCGRLGAAAGRPFAVGVFGMSQAGKSYLISSLARAADGELHTELDGQRLNFIGHVNPPGGGKEATGLVTRFTRRRTPTPPGYPVALTLFAEADLVKVLGNSFFNDFDRERVAVLSDPEEIRRHLARFEGAAAAPDGGLDTDAMVDVMDYFERRYAKSMAPLRTDFWPTVIDLAPRLPPAQRAGLLAPLWGSIPDFTRLYVLLQGALAQLGHARRVHAPLDALVVRTADGLHWNQESLVNVDVLNRLGAAGGTAPLTVLPEIDGRPGPPVAIARPLLTALAAEMTFVLADLPVHSVFEEVDLLDFPGYRGRLAVAGLDEVRSQLRRDDADPAAQLLLRGKVAYLFERYTEDQEMHVLIMCTRCDQQIEITTLAPVLTTWVHATQGETPEARRGRDPGLLWVLTQLDRRLEPKPGQTETQQRQEWRNMVHITLLERFGQCEWVREWADGRPFDTVFLVRKPGFLRSVVDTGPDNVERGLLPGEADRLAAARARFLADELVRRHIADPAAAWDAVLALNDGGMARLAAHLAAVARPGAKLARIAGQIEALADDVARHRLGPYFVAEDAGAAAQKEARAARVRQAVRDHPDTFGDLLHHLQLPADPVRDAYLRGGAGADAAAAADDAAGAAAPGGGLVRLPDTAAPGSAAAPPGGRAWRVARTVMRLWIRQLRELPDSAALRRHLGLDADVLRILTDELVTAADRLGLEQRVAEALAPLEEARAATRSRIADQQALLARTVVNGFVATLGMDALPLPERPASAVPGRPIFAPPPPIPPGALPVLPPVEVPYSGLYVLDWLEAFAHLAVGNAGHAAGRDITPEQNRRLGSILARIAPPIPARAP